MRDGADRPQVAPHPTGTSVTTTGMSHPMLKSYRLRSAVWALLALGPSTLSADAEAATAKDPTPLIRTSDTNPVPACVTPERLMSFLATRNTRLDPRFNDIAKHYKSFGEGWRVRWDYAFFQMAVETNFLTYRRPDGRMGDVDPKQNNFAGIGTTGGGVPGDRFPDVKTGVLAQIQHLVAYSGERLAQPVAPRTQLKQDDIVLASRELGRPVRFSDLARRWAVDKRYGQSIEWVASLYRSTYCSGKDAPAPAAKPAKTAAAETLPWQTGERPQASTVPATAPTPVPAPKPATASTTATPRRAETAAVPSAPQPRAAQRPASAVRTIWSKDGPKPSSPLSGPAALSTPGSNPDAIAEKLMEPAAEPAATAPAGLAFAPAVPGLLDASPESTATASVTPAAQPPSAQDTQVRQVTFDPEKTPPSGLGIKPSACTVRIASFGGSRTLLVHSQEQGKTTLTALTVLDGFEKSMLDSYVKSRQPGGSSIGTFASREEAIAKARETCPAS